MFEFQDEANLSMLKPVGISASPYSQGDTIGREGGRRAGGLYIWQFCVGIVLEWAKIAIRKRGRERTSLKSIPSIPT